MCHNNENVITFLTLLSYIKPLFLKIMDRSESSSPYLQFKLSTTLPTIIKINFLPQIPSLFNSILKKIVASLIQIGTSYHCIYDPVAYCFISLFHNFNLVNSYLEELSLLVIHNKAHML